jgi:hypothetical protein
MRPNRKMHLHKVIGRHRSPLSGKLSPRVMSKVYSEAGGIGRRIGLRARTEGCGTGEDAAAEQHAIEPVG